MVNWNINHVLEHSLTQVRPTQLPVATPPAQANRPEPGSFRDLAAAFQAALKGQAPAPAAAPPAIYAQPVQRMPDPAAEAPQRFLRPGSLLDIRV